MTADLFGLEQQTPRTNSRPEAAALVEVLKALRTHPAVAWAERMNTGAAKVGNRFIRFGWPDACALSKPYSWRASVPLVAWPLWRVTAAMCCAPWARRRGHEVPPHRPASINQPKDKYVPKIIRATAAPRTGRRIGEV